MSKVAEELRNAIRNGRQPSCPYCNAPLEVRQHQEDMILWKWSHEDRRYEKNPDYGDSGAPFCTNCGTPDWDFIDASSEAPKLCAEVGLAY